MLDVFIPSYNHADFVLDALESVRRIGVPKHIYVVDDASPDDSVAVIQRYLAEHESTDVSLIVKERNHGAIDSMVMFLERCRGTYVYTLASDDIAIPSGIEALVGKLEEQPDLGFIIGGGQNLLSDGSTTALYGRKHDKLFEVTPDRLAAEMFLRDPSPLLCQSSVFRRSALLEADALDPTIVADDYAIFGKLFRRFNRRGMTFDFLPKISCVLYRHHGGNSYLRLTRQAITHAQVIERVAPKAICNQAIGYKFSFLMLVALRHGKIRIALDLAKAAPPRSAGWLVAGLFVNAYHRLRYR